VSAYLTAANISFIYIIYTKIVNTQVGVEKNTAKTS